VGAECIQIFAKSPRQWRNPPIDPVAAADFVNAKRAMGFGPVFTHTAYLLNLSTTDPELLEKTVVALADELVRGGMLQVDGVVSHVGTDSEGDARAAAIRTAATIRAAYELAGEAGARARLLLENTAGGGSTYGCTFDQLGAIIDASGMPPEQLGTTFDTCHAFAFGMPLDTAEGWAEVVSEIGEHVGFERLGLVHANDAMFERGSRRDRHAWIGDGFIGETGFAAMLCSPEIAHVPAVVEMKGDKPMKDIVNIDRLKALREACASSH
jgi:deoxyribonuclease-4